MRKLVQALIVTTAVIQCLAYASPSNPTMQQMVEMEGVYTLTDGRTVRLTLIDDRLYVDLNQRDRLALAAVSENLFVTRDNEVTVERKPDADGKLVIRFNPNSRIAKVRTIAAKDRPVL